jgi:anti-anti-sigma factor
MQTEQSLSGELTIYTVAEMQPRFMEWAKQGSNTHASDAPNVLRIDASEVSEVDAAGIQLLIGMSRYLAARDEQLLLVNASQRLVRACEMLGVKSFLETTTSGDENGH